MDLRGNRPRKAMRGRPSSSAVMQCLMADTEGGPRGLGSLEALT